MQIGAIAQRCFMLALIITHSAPALSAEQGSAVLVGAGDIARCRGVQAEATARLLDDIKGTVFTVGDHAYPNGKPIEFLKCYDPTWGRHRKRTHPAPGNHDYDVADAGPYFDYFGANAGPAGRGYYSYDIGSWHIIALNSNPEARSWGAAQERWLIQDLSDNPATCTLAYWHHPRFSSGDKHGDHLHVGGLFRILYDHGTATAVLIAGHDHIYERFAPQNPDGVADALGIRQFIAGTGGARLYGFDRIKPNSEMRNATAHGVLKLTLRPESYQWEFITVPGQKFRDSGTGRCPMRKNGSQPSAR
jgi:hypothetical protein